MKFIICLLFSIAAISQTKPLDLKIDTIKSSTDEDNDRKFVLQYRITNLSDKAVSFVLNTKGLIPIGAGSLRSNPYFKIYENGKSFDAQGIFTSEKRKFESEKAVQDYNDSIRNLFVKKTLKQLLLEKKRNFLNNIQKLEPKETRNFEAVLTWNKQRYFKNDMYEYYIQEKENYYFELHINLMKEELLIDFSEEERNEILKDKDLTKGWYTSNKVLIDFSE